jgi:2-alkenal reductase
MNLKPTRILLSFLTLVVFVSLACQATGPILSPDATAVETGAEQAQDPAVDDNEATASEPESTRPPSPSINSDDPVLANNPITSAGLIDGQDLTQLYDTVSPGVVAIIVLTADGGGQGSGFVLDREGHIATNYHVVEGAEVVEIAFSSGYRVFGEVVGTDLDSDLAIVKVDAPSTELHPLPLGDSDAVKVGQFVVAIGNPFGLSGTMTVGIVSAKGRVLSSLNESPGGSFFSAGDLIQTDAAINPGNSGGPLLNINGEVIGINRAIFSLSETPANSGIGFAISINILKQVKDGLIADGFYDYPYLGVSSLPMITLFDVEQFDLPQMTGAFVTTIVPNGPAANGGLQVGDLIIQVDDREVITFSEMLSYLITQKEPGDDITLVVLRDEDRIELTVTLGSRP